MERPTGTLFIGETIDAESGDRTGTPLLLESADLTTHGVIVGMTGSGKTGLGVVLLEEALLSGIPVLAIDPKGDLGNLALTFPDLRAEDFEPWIDEGAVRIEGTTAAELAARTAESWQHGLASWGLGRPDLLDLEDAARPVIYTPGSTAGIQLNALGRLAVPSSDDPAVRQDEADATVSALLGLVGIDSDPLSGREHILIANLITRAWEADQDLDMPTLLAQIMNPPVRKLGVLELDTFYPPDDRRTLVTRLNGLLASPGFAAWAQGEPLDIASMLYQIDGRPRAAIVSLAHLDESERHFAVTLLLSRLISWMRTQSGTSELRALIYIDEMTGLAPPIANPAPKASIITLLKQARAFGVGLVLSTQNPADLDYKAISNAGTWMIGRLQTQQDKDRLLAGLRGADGATDTGAVGTLVSDLDDRQFVMRSTRSSDLPLFTTRWAMSYLAGPMTRQQISALMLDRLDAHDGEQEAGPSDVGPTLAEDESTLPPETPEDLPVRYVHPAAEWIRDLAVDPAGTRLEPALAARVNLLFDESKADVRQNEEWEAIIPLTGDAIDVDEAISVDFDERDLVADAPFGARYVAPRFNLTKTALRSARTALRARLYRTETLELFHNPELELWSRPGESREDFALRCRREAERAADAAAERIREKIESKRDRLAAALAKAEDRVAELDAQMQGRRTQQLVDLGSSLLGGLLGGRRSARSMAGAARRAASASSRSRHLEARAESAQNRVAEKIDDLENLEAELADALIEIDDEWSAKAGAIEVESIPLEKTDITIEDFVLVWLPT